MPNVAPKAPFHLTTCVGLKSASGRASVLSSAQPTVAKTTATAPSPKRLPEDLLLNTSNAPPAAIAARAIATRRPIASWYRHQAKKTVNTASKFKSKEALVASVCCRPQVRQIGAKTAPTSATRTKRAR